MSLTSINIDMRDPVTNTAPAGIVLVFTPTRRLKGLGLVPPKRVTLTGGLGGIDLYPTDDATTYGSEPWAWHVDEYWPGKDGVHRNVLVPTSVTLVQYDDLVEVGDSMTPPGPDGLWWVRLSELELSSQGPAGPAGPAGLSAYQLAVAGGFVGSQAAWIASLEGPQGPAGQDGAGSPATAASPPVGTAAVGTSLNFARQDHTHAVAADAIGNAAIQAGSVTYNKLGLADGDIPQAKVLNLGTSLAGKANTSHTHTEADVTGLVADLVAKAPTASPTFTGTATMAARAQTGRTLITTTTLSDAATILVDAALGDHFTVTLGGVVGATRVLGNPSNPPGAGQTQMILFAIRQDGTGGRALTLGTKYRLGADITAVTLSTGANKTDYLGVRYNVTDDKWDVIAFAKGF